MAVYHDKEFKEENVLIEVQVVLTEAELSNVHLRMPTSTIKWLPAKTVASVKLQGKPEEMTEVNTRVAEWLEANQQKLKGAIVNMYHGSFSHIPNTDEGGTTERCYPLSEEGGKHNEI